MSSLKIIVTLAFLFLIHIKDGQSCQSSPTTYIVAHDCYRDEDCAGGRCVFISSGNKCQSGQREGNRISDNDPSRRDSHSSFNRGNRPSNGQNNWWNN